MIPSGHTKKARYHARAGSDNHGGYLSPPTCR
jgi:hypothetical protein